MERKNTDKIIIVGITAFLLGAGFFLISHNTVELFFQKEWIRQPSSHENFEDDSLDVSTQDNNSRIIDSHDSTLSVPTSGKAIWANLSEMKLTLFNNGEIESEFSILAKGSEGSRYETPTGIYKIEAKEVNHKVSVRDVYMPYSMQFFGNFFIHGRPYYTNGTPLVDGDSGGCLRLSTEDAKKVFAFAERGTPVFIVEPEENEGPAHIPSSFFESAKGVTVAPQVSAASYLAADLNTGFVFAEKNSSSILSIGSLTTLMTALLSDEVFRDDREIAVPFQSADQSIRAGDILTATELLRPLLLEHDSFAADVLASDIGRGMFVGLMNRKAGAIGMTDTHFVDAAGEDLSNTSTGEDIFKLVKYVHKKHTPLSKISAWSTSSTGETFQHKVYTWESVNSFVKNDSVMLSSTAKISEFAENSTLVVNVDLEGEKIPLAIIIFGSSDEKSDVQNLLEWIKVNYKINIPPLEN
jgi:serine-type D-Ala-D-Ala endopeptidase (penicillin-binding protein 7)